MVAPADVQGPAVVHGRGRCRPVARLAIPQLVHGPRLQRRHAVGRGVGAAVRRADHGCVVRRVVPAFRRVGDVADMLAVHHVAGVDGRVAKQVQLAGRHRNTAQIALEHDLRIQLVGDEARPVKRRRAGEDAVEVVRMQLRELVALPATRGEAVPVRVLRGLAVVGLGNLLRLHGHFVNAALREVVPQDRVDAAIRVHRERSAAGPAVSGVCVRRNGAFHRRNKRRARRGPARAARSREQCQRRLITAGPPTATGNMNPAVPVFARRQPHFDADARRG